MKNWSFYDATGQLSGRTFSGPERLLSVNTPSGLTAVEGHHDHLSKRVDVATGHVVDYQPDQPDADHEWNAETKRWQLKPEVIERNQRQAAAQSQLEALDLKEIRAISDLLADPYSKEAMDRLTDIRAQKDSQRERLK